MWKEKAEGSMPENEIMEHFHVFIRIKCRFKCDC